MNRKFLTIVVALLLVVGLAWYGVDKYRKDSKIAEIKNIIIFVDNFRSELTLAKSTPRHSLSNRIADMEHTRRQLQAIEVKSACTAKVRDDLSSTMSSDISVFSDFLVDRSSSNFDVFDAHVKYLGFGEKLSACWPKSAADSIGGRNTLT